MNEIEKLRKEIAEKEELLNKLIEENEVNCYAEICEKLEGYRITDFKYNKTSADYNFCIVSNSKIYHFDTCNKAYRSSILSCGTYGTGTIYPEDLKLLTDVYRKLGWLDYERK